MRNYFIFYPILKFKEKYVSVSVAVYALFAVKVYKLRLLLVSRLKEIKEKLLAFFLGVYHSYSGANSCVEALDLVYLSVIEDSALDKVMIGHVEVFFDIGSVEHSLSYSEFLIDTALGKLGH